MTFKTYSPRLLGNPWALLAWSFFWEERTALCDLFRTSKPLFLSGLPPSCPPQRTSWGEGSHHAGRQGKTFPPSGSQRRGRGLLLLRKEPLPSAESLKDLCRCTCYPACSSPPDLEISTACDLPWGCGHPALECSLLPKAGEHTQTQDKPQNSEHSLRVSATPIRKIQILTYVTCYISSLLLLLLEKQSRE